jgi:hypothetical protein
MRAVATFFLVVMVAGCSDDTSGQRASLGAIGGIAACGLAGGPIGAFICTPIGIAASYALPKNDEKPNSNSPPAGGAS